MNTIANFRHAGAIAGRSTRPGAFSGMENLYMGVKK